MIWDAPLASVSSVSSTFVTQVHQECAERTVILDQLNQLRREASLPPLPQADLHRLAAEYMAKTGGPGPASVGARGAALRRGECGGDGVATMWCTPPPYHPASRCPHPSIPCPPCFAWSPCCPRGPASSGGPRGPGPGALLSPTALAAPTGGEVVSLPPLPRSRGSSQQHLAGADAASAPAGEGDGDGGSGDGFGDGAGSAEADGEAAAAWLSSGRSRGAGRGRGRGRGR